MKLVTRMESIQINSNNNKNKTYTNKVAFSLKCTKTYHAPLITLIYILL